MRKRERAVGLAQSLSFVVGDADQSIYSFRLADFTILLDSTRLWRWIAGRRHPHDGEAGGKLPLRENKRLTIANNTQRIDKILKPTRGVGEQMLQEPTMKSLKLSLWYISAP